MENEKNYNSEEYKDAVKDHPEWATCIMGKLLFCPVCHKETLLSDGIKSICTNCDYKTGE